jgi:membrane protease YdiL (CAAX protease family)
MEQWSTTDWVTIGIFSTVTTTGITAWWYFWRQPAVRKAEWLLDHSVRARWGLVDVLVTGLLWLACQAFTFGLLAVWYDLPRGQPPTGELAARFGLIGGLVQLVVVTLCLFVLARRYGHCEQDFGLARWQWRNGITAGLLAFAMWIPLVWAVQTILVSFVEYTHPSFDRVQQSRQLKTLLDTWLTAVLIAPVVEEILFRSIIQGWLQRTGPAAREDAASLITGQPGSVTGEGPCKPRPVHIPAILTTAVLFGLAHYSQGPAPISLFVLSLGLGYLYQRTGSLIACIVMHMLLNTITMFLFTLNLSTA